MGSIICQTWCNPNFPYLLYTTIMTSAAAGWHWMRQKTHRKGFKTPAQLSDPEPSHALPLRCPDCGLKPLCFLSCQKETTLQIYFQSLSKKVLDLWAPTIKPGSSDGFLAQFDPRTYGSWALHCCCKSTALF